MKWFKNYKWGIDFLGLLLAALIALPLIVYWCIPEFAGMNAPSKALDVFSYIFEFLGLAAMAAIVAKDAKPYGFFTLTGTLTWLFLVLYYISWIFYFVGFTNVAVILFVAVSPCVTLLAYQAGKKNYIAMAPTALFALLHIIAAFIIAF